MLKFVYSVQYVPSGEFGPPFVATSGVHATRILRSMLRDIPDLDRVDFKLFEIGQFDDQTGELFVRDAIEEVDNE